MRVAGAAGRLLSIVTSHFSIQKMNRCDPAHSHLTQDGCDVARSAKRGRGAGAGGMAALVRRQPCLPSTKDGCRVCVAAIGPLEDVASRCGCTAQLAQPSLGLREGVEDVECRAL